MPSYTLEIVAFGTYAGNMPALEIWEDGALDSTHSISSNGTSISITINYGGSLPTSLEFRFNDAFPAAGRTIEIQSVKINNMYVNTGNYLSSDSLTKGQAAVVDIDSVNTNDSDFIFDSSEPAISEFTTGATQTFTAGDDTYRDYNSASDEVFDLLAGRDVAYLGSGNDKVNGNDGNDIIRGGAGSDLLYGGDGDDRLYGDDGDDRLYGGIGDDLLYGNDGNDEIHGGAGNDRLNGHDGDDVITGGIGEDKLNGGNGSDYLFGGDDADSLVGGSGADTLDGGAGNDILYGGTDDDIINGGDGNDILVGNIGADIIHGDDGDDIIYLMSNDFSAGELIYGGAGTDELILTHASTINFTIGGLAGLETLTGSDDDQNVTFSASQFFDFSTIDYGGGTDTQTILIAGTYDVTALTIPTLSGLESSSLTFSSGADYLTISGAQFDTLTLGQTTFNTLGGNDVLNITSTSVNLNAFGSVDGGLINLETIDASSAASGVVITMSGQTEDFTIIGSANNDTIIGGAGDDIINGGDGNDTINGGAGTDTVDYRMAASGVSVDLSIAVAQNTGGGGNDTLSNIENIYGSDYDDFLKGDNNVNSLTGGTGADTFVFDSNSIDVVTDFSEAQGDILDISDIVSGTVRVDDINDFLRLQDSGSDTNVLVDRNGTNGGANFSQVGVLRDVTGLSAQNLFDNGQVVEGGKVLCGHFYNRGLLSSEIYSADLFYAAQHFDIETKRGYRIWAVPLTNYLNNNPGGVVEKIVQPFVLSWAKEMAYRAGISQEQTIIGRFLLDSIVPCVRFLGKFVKDTDYSKLQSEAVVKKDLLSRGV